MKNNIEKMIMLPEYYIDQGLITDPGEYAHLLDQLPDSVPEIVDVIHGLLIHIFWAERYGMIPSEEQKEHVQTRYVSKILERIMSMDVM